MASRRRNDSLGSEYGSFLQLATCVIAVSLDPLFLYIPVINDHEKCIKFDKKLRIATLVLRSVTDIIFILHIAFRFLAGYVARLILHDRDGVNQRVASSRERAKTYMLSYFLINLLSLLPLPQVVILSIIPEMKGSKSAIARNSLIALVMLQYVPRVVRIYQLYKELTWTPRIFKGTRWKKAAFNLFLYMLASHVLGALWYFFSIERERTCWQEACEGHPGCDHSSFFCDDGIRATEFLHNMCPIDTPNTNLFDFGIFLDALQSGIVESVNIHQKLFRCLWWGLQNLSSLGQNLKTSTYVWENIFAVFISTSGLVLFLYFIGNMQTYMQMKTVKKEEKRMEREIDVDSWMSNYLLPERIKRRIKQSVEKKWHEIRTVDLKNLIPMLPEDLQQEIKRFFCWELLKSVPAFESMDDQLLDAICIRLKPWFHPKESIVREGDRVDKMYFIIRGEVRPRGLGLLGFVNEAYFFEELLTWAREGCSSDNLPISIKTLEPVTEVEAFVLKNEDLRFLSSIMATDVIKGEWRNYVERKKKILELNRRLEEGWGNYHLPERIKRRIKQSVEKKWHEIRTVDLKNLIPMLPEGLQQEIKRFFCWELLKSVPAFASMDDQLLDAICIRLKPWFHPRESYIVRERNSVDKMYFIIRGEVRALGLGLPDFVNEAYFCEELLTWACEGCSSDNLPISNGTLQACIEVEAFVLKNEDLRFLSSNCADPVIQTKWRNYVERKKEILELNRRLEEGWRNYDLPELIKRRIKHSLKKNKHEIRTVDLENLIPMLPEDPQQDIKRFFCWELLKSVPAFESMDDQLLDAICIRLKPWFHPKESYIVQEGDSVDKMYFIIRGEVCSDGFGFSNSVNQAYLCEELLTWAREGCSSDNLPISKGTLQACTEVEAFVLKNEDLRSLSSTMAADVIQTKWRIYVERKKEALELNRRLEEEWRNYHLPERIKRRIKQSVEKKWHEIRTVNLENLIPMLPEDLQQEIKRFFCWELLKSVPAFESMDDQLLDAICIRLKPLFHPGESYIVREGDSVDKMYFIIRGEVRSRGLGLLDFVNEAYLCEELLTWAREGCSSDNLPISNGTLQARTEVEAFVLKNEDLRFLSSTMAADVIQGQWRIYVERKKKILELNRKLGEECRNFCIKVQEARENTSNGLRLIQEGGRPKLRR